MKYSELKINADRNDLEATEAALIEAGFASMQIDDALDAADIAEHPDTYKYDYINEDIIEKANKAAGGNRSDSITLTLYFTADEEGRSELKTAEAVLEGLKNNICRNLSYSVTETADDSEWLYRWQEYFRPVRLGERIVVKPGWENYDPADGDLVIEMDPGMAFGSGLHETTSMCVRALEKTIGDLRHGHSQEQIRVLDVGTGTGILAIAAALLGADSCFGIDIDDEAVRVARENISRNGLEDRIVVCRGDLMEGVDYEADVIAANLMADLVIKLSPAAYSHMRSGGIYITSGILDIKEKAVTEGIEAAGFKILEVLADGEWRAVIAAKPRA